METSSETIVVDGRTVGRIAGDRKQARLLAELQANLSALLESTDDLIWTVD